MGRSSGKTSKSIKESCHLLNELAVLSQSLKMRGIQVQPSHPWIEPFRQGEALVAELDAAGGLARVSLLSAEEVAGIRQIKPGNFKSFPGFNLNCPIFKIEDAALWNQTQALWERTAADVLSCQLAYKQKDVLRLERLLGDFPVKEIGPLLAAGGAKLEAASALVDRLKIAAFKAEGFLRGLGGQILSAERDGRLSRSMALEVLYGKANKEKMVLHGWQITLILDVSDMDRFPYRVADPAVAGEFSDALFKSAVKPGGPAFRCSLTGRLDSPVGGKMPSPNLRILGPTYLMSMNKNARCQARYGRTSTDIFPIGRESAQGLNDALRFVTEIGRHNKTWTGVPNAVKGEDLLISYLEEEPESEVPIIGMFADSGSDADVATYESRTREIHTALLARNGSKRDLQVRVFALSEIDPGRTQVLFGARYGTGQIYAGRDRWLAGARNVPGIQLPFAVGKGKPAEYRGTFAPSPTQVMDSFKRQWLKAGQVFHAVPGVDLSRIYGLLFDSDSAKQATWLLERYQRLTEPLLVGIGRVRTGGRKTVLPDFARNMALIVVAVYGILLFRQGREKEIYMQSRDYLLGQFLQLSDTLHKLYCKNQRKDSMPAQLIGNAAIAMATQSPSRALRVLGQRMAVYLAWANRYKGEQVGLVKWCLGELRKIATLLKDCNLESRVSGAGKAELFLGYLANVGQEEVKDN
jgi:hypothetical protein